MLNSLFDKKTAKLFDTIATQKADLHEKEKAATNAFMDNCSAELINKVLDISESFGHPNEQKQSRELRNKYNTSELEFDDIMTLNALYKSNYKFFENKDAQK